MNESIMAEIVKRTKGEFYIGCVGSVRSGKSTFIKRFIEVKILPYVNDDLIKNKIIDELPQSASGRTIMTVEPKFIPNQTVTIKIESEMEMQLRLVDSVGYIIPSALGYYNDSGPRYVKTPWFSEDIPFKEAAEIGTKKVIENHSNLGIMITSDGSINEFSRDEFKQVEDEVISELLKLDKPFVIVLNSINPNALETQKIKNEIEDKYDVPVIAVNVQEMTNSDIDKILKSALTEFKISELNIKVPSWLTALNNESSYKTYLDSAILESTEKYKKYKHITKIKDNLLKYDLFENVQITDINPSTGSASIKIECGDNLYYQILDELLEGKVTKKEELITLLVEYKENKKEFESIKEALNMVNKTGYGISLPNVEKMRLEKPEVIKQGSRYGVKLKAIAPSIHLVKVDVESTFEPIIGSLEQSKGLIDDLNSGNVDIWKQEIFGRSLSSLVNDGIKAKLFQFPESVKEKFKLTLEKIVNNGSGGIIAIII